MNNEITNNLNKSLLEKRQKLENLHSRIIRINKILGKLEGIPQALTLLSKKFYPENVESFQHTSVFYNNICDYSMTPQVQKFKENTKKINTKPSNSLEDLGRAPDINMDDVKLSQEIFNSITQFDNYKSNLNPMNSLNPVEYQPITKEIEMLTSVINFTSKIKAYGNQKLSEVNNLRYKESDLLNDFMSISNFKTKKSKNNQKKPISKAPPPS
jgi:hypothetical protein